MSARRSLWSYPQLNWCMVGFSVCGLLRSALDGQAAWTIIWTLLTLWSASVAVARETA